MSTAETQEGIPYYQLPPPGPVESLPEPDKTRKFQPAQYWKLARNPNHEFDECNYNNDILKKVVLNEIGKLPEIWSSKNSYAIKKNFPIVAIETFKRMGVLLSLKSIKSIYKCGKDNLRNRLRAAIVHKKLTAQALEDHLWKWDYYPFIRFYREYTQTWEAGLLQKRMDGVFDAVGKTEDPKHEEYGDNGMGIVEEAYEDDDIIWDEAPEAAPQPAQHQRDEHFYQPQYRQSESSNYQPSVVSYSHQMPPPIQVPRANVTDQIRMLNSMESFDSGNDVSSTTIPAAALVDFRQEMSQISFQASRIAREQPERIKILRKALFDVVLEFDQKEYNSVGELYRTLAQKHSK